MSTSDGAFVTPEWFSILMEESKQEMESTSTRGWIALRPGRFMVSEGKADVISSDLHQEFLKSMK